MNETQRISAVDGGGKNVGNGSGDRRPEAAWTAGEPGFVDSVSRLDVGLARDVGDDPLRVYATGLSNGGGMAHRLACEAADVFAAAAPVAFPLALDPLTAPSAPASFAYWATADGCTDGPPDMIEDLGNGPDRAARL